MRHQHWQVSYGHRSPDLAIVDREDPQVHKFHKALSFVRGTALAIAFELLGLFVSYQSIVISFVCLGRGHINVIHFLHLFGRSLACGGYFIPVRL
jgi:hypothetical protein